MLLAISDFFKYFFKVHKNPTFYCSVGQSNFVPLPKDVWVELSHGDMVSLLPSELIFSVEITQDQTQYYDIAGGNISTKNRYNMSIFLNCKNIPMGDAYIYGRESIV